MFLRTLVIALFITSNLHSQNTGINESNPKATLDVNGAIKLNTNENMPSAGMVKWNEARGDFEGFDGKEWRSLTRTSAVEWGPGVINNTVEDQILIDESGSSGDWFGGSVAIDSNFAVVGAYRVNSFVGRIVIFERINGNWQKDTTINGPGGSILNFGYDVDIYENRIAIGAPYGNGKVYVYKNIGGVWALDDNGTFNYNSPSWVAGFGLSLSLSADKLLIGAPYSNVPSASLVNSGIAFIYTLKNEIWSINPMQFNYENANTNAYSLFGFSVDLHNDLAIIGEPGRNGASSKEGIAHIYKYSSGIWTPQESLTINGAAEDDQLGYSVAISDGVAAIGVPFDEIPNTNVNEGVVVLVKEDNGSWIINNYLRHENSMINDHFGISIDINKNTLLVGANIFDSQGRVFVYDLEPNSPRLVVTIKPSYKYKLQYTDTSVEMDEHTIIIGGKFAVYDDSSQKGAAYIIKKN